MGCRYKISSLGCIATTLQIGALVDPTSNTIVSSPINRVLVATLQEHHQLGLIQ
jgi:hypothetical protein